MDNTETTGIVRTRAPLSRGARASVAAATAAPATLDMAKVGAHQDGQSVRFGIWLPGVSPQSGDSVRVKVIHEADQFLQRIPPRIFPLTHSREAPYGDFWSGTVDVVGTPPGEPGSAWGRSGPDERYVYRYCVQRGDGSEIDWVVDPFAREFGVGKLAAFTLGYQAFAWDPAVVAEYRTPDLSDLVLYELNLAEFGGDIDRAIERLAYLQDLGVRAIEVMPVSNVAIDVDWGYLPLGYFGVDERFGKRRDFQRFVQEAHRRGLAVVVDAVYGHTADDFAYEYLYRRLGRENPFMGSFGANYFGASTDYGRALTRDYFLAVNRHWLEVYQVDGFRYDCVPNYWDGATGQGYARLVYETFELTRRELASADAGSPWRRFGEPERPTLVQMAEQLEAPEQVLYETYTTSTWQNRTYDSAVAVARGDRGRLGELGHRLGALGFPAEHTTNGVTLPRAPLQYIENHDHERFVCHFGTVDRDGNPLFREGDRGRWFKVQPYLMGLLASKGIPMLWQGQEFGENYFLPNDGLGRVMLLRPMRWDYFYDEIGKRLVKLTRDLLRLRRDLPQLRTGSYFFFDDWDRYQSRGLLLFARYTDSRYTLVALNTSDSEQTVPFWFPFGGRFREELHGGALDLQGVQAWQPTSLTIPSNYGRIWTSAGA
jgi:maltooligosyltrehalose trehalohydrolase